MLYQGWLGVGFLKHSRGNCGVYREAVGVSFGPAREPLTKHRNSLGYCPKCHSPPQWTKVHLRSLCSSERGSDFALYAGYSLCCRFVRICRVVPTRSECHQVKSSVGPSHSRSSNHPGPPCAHPRATRGTERGTSIPPTSLSHQATSGSLTRAIGPVRPCPPQCHAGHPSVMLLVTGVGCHVESTGPCSEEWSPRKHWQRLYRVDWYHQPRGR